MSLTEPELGAFIVVFLRTAAVAATAPVIGDSGVSMRARLVFCVAIAVALAANRTGVQFADLPATAILEVASGVITGLTARFVMARVAIAGQLVGLSLGLGFASEYDVHAGENAGVLRTIATTMAGIAFLLANGLEAIVRGVAAPASPLVLAGTGEALLREGTAAFGHGLALAAPIVLAALVGNVGLAVMNRAAPAVNVFAVALSAILLLGGMILLATAGGFVQGITDVARESVHVLAP